MSENIQIVYGKQTFPHSSCDVVIQAYGGDGVKAFPSRFLPVVNTIKMLAALDRYEAHGKWFNATLKHNKDLILSIRVSKYVNASCRASCVLLLRLRKGADLIQVDVQTPPDALAAHERLPVFTGHADIISPEEAQMHGARLSQGILRNMVDPRDVSQHFSVQVVSAGTVDKPELRTISTKSGEKVVEVPKPRRVRITLPDAKK